MAQNIFMEFNRLHLVLFLKTMSLQQLSNMFDNSRQRWIVPPLGARITNLARLFDGGKVISLELDTHCWPSVDAFPAVREERVRYYLREDSNARSRNARIPKCFPKTSTDVP